MNQPLHHSGLNGDELASSLAFTTHIAEGLHGADPANTPTPEAQPAQGTEDIDAKIQAGIQEQMQPIVEAIQQLLNEPGQEG